MASALSPSKLLVILLIGCAFLALLGLAGPTISQVVNGIKVPAIEWTEHATLHAEAAKIIQCLEPKNIRQVWINSSGERLNCLVDTGDGKIGDAVIQWSCKRAKWIGITAYQVGDGELGQAMDVLLAKACSMVWSK